MKIAIPLFQNRVSPRFDFAPALMVATIENNQVVAREEISLKNYTLPQRSALLLDLAVTTLICGGIQGPITRSLGNKSIQVIAPVAGEATEVLECFLRGELHPPCFLLESPHRCGRRWGNPRRMCGRDKENN
jgi:predicted Fe-Mo cluster-binding NifX family protein